jgi:hypothetical protein
MICEDRRREIKTQTYSFPHIDQNLVLNPLEFGETSFRFKMPCLIWLPPDGYGVFASARVL